MLAVRRDLRRYIDAAGVARIHQKPALPVEFLHRDEFVRDYPQQREPPAAGRFSRWPPMATITPFIDAPEMDAADLNGLMALVRARL